jgi:uncharacterized short protein YbdD (DUF466 family)
MSGAATGAASRLSSLVRCACDTARLMVGVPSYDAYCAHMAATHPGQPPMSYAEFFRDRQDARFGAKGGGGFKCC